MIPEPPRRKDGRGRPWRGRREVLNGIVFILRTGALWADLPSSILLTRPATAVSSNGIRSGVMRGRAEGAGRRPAQPWRIDLEEAFIDGSFAPAKGGAGLSKTKRESLVMQTLTEIFVEEPVQRLIGDNAYDSDQLDRELAETGGSRIFVGWSRVMSTL